jgi:thiol-disulfide isomerase/thioredoxin
MGKTTPLIILGIIILVAIAFFVIAKNPTIIYTIFNTNQKTVLEDGMTLKDPYFSDKVIVIHSISCMHCLVTVPILREIENETGKTFIYYDISKEADLKEVTKLGLVIKGVPTIIIYGEVFLGSRSKEVYLEAISKQ